MCHRKWDLIGIFAWDGKSCKTLLHSDGRAKCVQGTKLQCQNRRIPVFSLKQKELTLQDTKTPKRLYQLPHRLNISTYHAKNKNGPFFVTIRSVFTVWSTQITQLKAGRTKKRKVFPLHGPLLGCLGEGLEDARTLSKSMCIRWQEETTRGAWLGFVNNFCQATQKFKTQKHLKSVAAILGRFGLQLWCRFDQGAETATALEQNGLHEEESRSCRH